MVETPLIPGSNHLGYGIFRLVTYFGVESKVAAYDGGCQARCYCKFGGYTSVVLPPLGHYSPKTLWAFGTPSRCICTILYLQRGSPPCTPFWLEDLYGGLLSTIYWV